jgi:hypothetical protein
MNDLVRFSFEAFLGLWKEKTPPHGMAKLVTYGLRLLRGIFVTT